MYWLRPRWNGVFELSRNGWEIWCGLLEASSDSWKWRPNKIKKPPLESEGFVLRRSLTVTSFLAFRRPLALLVRLF